MPMFSPRQKAMELEVDGPPVHVGWVKKQSKHVGKWRQRWMVLLGDGTALFFPQDFDQASQGVLTGGDAGAMDILRSDPTSLQRLGMPSEKFKVRGMSDTSEGAKSPRLHHPVQGARPQASQSSKDELKIFVEYASTRDAIKKKFGSKVSGERYRFVAIDAELAEKLKWKMSIREVLQKLPPLPREMMCDRMLEDVEGTAEVPDTTGLASNCVGNGVGEDLRGLAA